MITAALFAVAAAAGGLLRWWSVRLPVAEPELTGIALVNVAGAFALGLLSNLDAPAITVVGVGGLGALTTLSTLAGLLVGLIEQDRWRAATGYGLGTALAGIGAAWLGLSLA